MISPHLSGVLQYHLGSFHGRLVRGELIYPEDVAMALDDLAILAWKEVRESYPNSVLLEGESIDNTSSVSKS